MRGATTSSKAVDRGRSKEYKWCEMVQDFRLPQGAVGPRDRHYTTLHYTRRFQIAVVAAAWFNE